MSAPAAPLFTSERLEYWMPGPDDWREFHEIVRHPQTAKYLGPPDELHGTFARHQKNAGSWLMYGYGMFMLRRKDEDEIVGGAGVFHTFRGLGDDFDDKPEAAWIMRHDICGKGYAHEALSAILQWFDAAHPRKAIVCLIAQGNTPSVRLAERLGFHPFRTTKLGDDPADMFTRAPT